MGAFSALFAFTEGKRVMPSAPPGRTPRISPIEEPAAPRRARNGVSGLGLYIEYVDRNGEPSERRIACRSYDPGHDAINAWCFEREAPRQFRLERIGSAVCTETGELFELAFLLQTLRARGLPVDDKCLGRVLLLLTFLMRCDGVHASETTAIEDSIERFAVRFDGDEALVAQGYRLAGTLAPDHDDFRRTMRWLAMRGNGPQLARFVRNEAASVIDADGRHSEEEARFGAELGEALTQIVNRA